MPVQIIPVGFLASAFPAGALSLAEGAGKTISEILQELDLQPDLVAMVLVNGRQVPKDAVLRDGDVVKLIPFVGGG